MAQRTAFLNSDAKGYNKDFHHTWIHNYLLQQVGVMFSDYSTKPEFKLGNGQISGGKAIIRCTRTTGTFAGSKMLALYESTSTETISTAGNKKVFIEIPEIFVNDSSSITDTLTQGINLGVGVIKSETDYPNHTNYIPLWEITGGDWANAVDVRPEILYRGQPNSISYFDNNGVERKLVLDSGSLNKFLKSNGAGVAPSRAELGDVVEVTNLKNTFFAGEDILPKSMFKVEREMDTIDAIDESINCGYNNNTSKVQINTILSGDDFDTIKANIEGFNSPADVVEVRIESVDSNGNATGSLIHVDAHGTITPTGTMGEVLITLNGTISGMVAGTPVAVVFSRSGALSTSNYYKVGVATADTGIRHIKTFNGTSWNKETGKKGYVSSDGFLDEGAIQSKATTVFLSEYTGYCEAGALAGNSFTGITTGMVDVDNMSAGDKIYLTDTGEIDNVEGTVKTQVGTALRAGLVELGVRGVGGESISIYDAIVDAGGKGDYLTVGDAINDGKTNIYVMPGTYTETYWDLTNKIISITGETKETSKIVFDNDDNQNTGKCYMNLSSTKGVYIKNIGINFLFNSKNIYGLYSSNNVENITVRFDFCFIEYDSNSGAKYLIYGSIFGLPTRLPNYSLRNYSGGSGFFDCVFYNESTTGTYMSWTAKIMYVRCSFITPSDRGTIVLGQCHLNNCFLEVYNLNMSGLYIENTSIKNIYGEAKDSNSSESGLKVGVFKYSYYYAPSKNVNGSGSFFHSTFEIGGDLSLRESSYSDIKAKDITTGSANYSNLDISYDNIFVNGSVFNNVDLGWGQNTYVGENNATFINCRLKNLYVGTTDEPIVEAPEGIIAGCEIDYLDINSEERIHVYNNKMRVFNIGGNTKDIVVMNNIVQQGVECRGENGFVMGNIGNITLATGSSNYTVIGNANNALFGSKEGHFVNYNKEN